jgi:hypothetical protein
MTPLVSPLAIGCVLLAVLLAAYGFRDPSASAVLYGGGDGGSGFEGPREFTALMRLAARGDLPSVSSLLAKSVAAELPRLLNTESPDGQSCLHFALQGRMNQMHDPARVKQLSGEHERVIGRARPFPVKSFSLFLGNYHPITGYH